MGKRKSGHTPQGPPIPNTKIKMLVPFRRGGSHWVTANTLTLDIIYEIQQLTRPVPAFPDLLDKEERWLTLSSALSTGDYSADEYEWSGDRTVNMLIAQMVNDEVATEIRRGDVHLRDVGVSGRIYDIGILLTWVCRMLLVY